MNSFYGGQQGKSFKISAIFRSANERPSGDPRQSLTGDLNLGWNSPIGIGELVFISYGLPGVITSTSYDVYGYNKELDHNLGHAYNGTIWQKIYKEPDTGHEIPQDELTGIEILWAPNRDAEGFGYKLIASTTGTTPTLTVQTQELLPEQSPDVVINNTDLDFPILTFKLPVMPEFLLINSPVDSTGDAPDVKWLPPDGLPTVSIVKDWDNPDESQQDEDLHFVFSMPKPIEQIEIDQENTQIIDNPNVDGFSVSLEKNADWQATTPTESGQYNSHFGYDLAFEIPRAARFFYGPLSDVIGSAQHFDPLNPSNLMVIDPPFVQNDHEMHEGDYFIDTDTGFLFTPIDEVEYEGVLSQNLTFLARFDTKIPTVIASNGEYTYELDEGEWVLKQPVATRTYIEGGDGKDWQMQFVFPPLPSFSVTDSFIGAEEGQGSVVGSLVPGTGAHSEESNEYQIAFTIPRGSRWYAGTGDPIVAATPNCKLGDYWLDGETGLLWKYALVNNEPEWTELLDPLGNQYSIRGPVGKALNIIAYKEYTATQAPNYDDIIDLLEEDYPEATDEQIVSVYWPSNDTTNAAVYWFTNTRDNGWVGTKVTGNISHLLKNEYYDNGDSDDFGYTVEYINGLLKDDFATENKDKVGYSARFIEELLSWGEFGSFSPILDPNSIVFSSLQPFRIGMFVRSLSHPSTDGITYSLDLNTYENYPSFNTAINANKVGNVYLVSFKGENFSRLAAAGSIFGFTVYDESKVYCTGNLSNLIIKNSGTSSGTSGTANLFFADNRRIVQAPNLDLQRVYNNSYCGFFRSARKDDQFEKCGYIDYQSVEGDSSFTDMFKNKTNLKTIPQLPGYAQNSASIFAVSSMFSGCNFISFSDSYSSFTSNIYRIPPFTNNFEADNATINDEFIVYPDAKIYTNAEVIYPPSWTKENNENKFYVYYPLEKGFPENTVHPAIGRVENGSFVAVSDSEYSTPVLYTKGDRVYISCGDADNDFVPKLYTWSNNPENKTEIVNIVDESATNNIYYTWIDGTNAEISGCKVYSFIMPENKVIFVCENGGEKAMPYEWERYLQ